MSLRIVGFLTTFAMMLLFLYYLIWAITRVLGYDLRHRSVFMIFGLLAGLVALGNVLNQQGIPFADEISTIIMVIPYTIMVCMPIILVLHLLSIFTPIRRWIAMSALGLRIGLAVYFGNVVQFTDLVIENTGLTTPKTVLFLSDLHLDKIRSTQYSQYLVDIIAHQNPDLVLLGGDLLNRANPAYMRGLEPFNQLTMPVFAVLGNHDHMGNPQVATAMFAKSNIRPLVNESITIDGLQIIGIQDESRRGSYSLTDMLDASQIQSGSDFTVLVSHQPQHLSKLQNYPIDLQLAGHTHRGQFAPFSWLIGLFNDYAYGRYDHDGKIAFVSQGVGTRGGPLRMGTQSEIVRIMLK